MTLIFFLGGGGGWRGEMENCAYLRKNPGYAPEINKSTFSNRFGVVWTGPKVQKTAHIWNALQNGGCVHISVHRAQNARLSLDHYTKTHGLETALEFNLRNTEKGRVQRQEQFTAMIILHFHLQPQFKYELFHIYFTSFHSLREDMNSINWPCSQCVAPVSRRSRVRTPLKPWFFSGFFFLTA